MNLKLLGILWLAALATSCGYSTRSLMPAGAEKVAVDIFGNETFYREIEFQLTREINEELNHRSSLKVTRRRSADAVLTGRITKVDRATLVETRDDEVSEQAVIVHAEVALRSLKSDEVLASFVVSNRAEFIVERGESLQSAFDEALKDLAEDIVNELERQSFFSDMQELRSQSPKSE